jgi:hypothetical protein
MFVRARNARHWARPVGFVAWQAPAGQLLTLAERDRRGYRGEDATAASANGSLGNQPRRSHPGTNQKDMTAAGLTPETGGRNDDD